MTIEEQIALFKRFLKDCEERIEYLEFRVGMKGSSGAKGRLIAEYERVMAKLNSCIGMYTSYYEQWKDDGSSSNYDSYLHFYSIAESLRKKCSSLKSEIEDKQKQRDVMYKRIKIITHKIQSLETLADNTEE